MNLEHSLRHELEVEDTVIFNATENWWGTADLEEAFSAAKGSYVSLGSARPRVSQSKLKKRGFSELGQRRAVGCRGCAAHRPPGECEHQPHPPAGQLQL